MLALATQGANKDSRRHGGSSHPDKGNNEQHDRTGGVGSIYPSRKRCLNRIQPGVCQEVEASDISNRSMKSTSASTLSSESAL